MGETTWRSRLVCLSLVCLSGISGIETIGVGVSFAQGVPPQPAPLSPPEKNIDLYLSGHVMGLFPQNEDLSVGGSRIPHTDVRGAIGAGIKFDIYPWFTRKIVGVEIEAFGLGGSVRAPRTTSGTGTTEAQGSLIALATMYNVILRYPGETVHPYIGVGGGTSTGILHSVNITSGNVRLSGSSADFAFAYQFLAACESS